MFFLIKAIHAAARLSLVFIIPLEFCLGQIVSNGGFESPKIAEGAFMTIFPGGEPAGFDWTVASGTVDLGNLPIVPFVLYDAFEGKQAVDLNGVNRGSIFQEFSTVEGESYSLSFIYADNPAEGGESTASVLVTDVADGSVLLSASISHSTSTNGPPPEADEDVYEGFFTANGPLTRLTIESTSASNTPSGGILIDAVVVDRKDCLRGDINLDKVVNLLDVAPFVSAITTGEFSCEADINSDQAVNLLDVAPFVQILTGG